MIRRGQTVTLLLCLPPLMSFVHPLSASFPVKRAGNEPTDLFPSGLHHGSAFTPNQDHLAGSLGDQGTKM